MLVIENPLDCPDCNYHFVAETYFVVDTRESATTTLEKLTRGILNEIECPKCGFKAQLDDLLLYNDGVHQILLALLPQQSPDAMPLSQGIDHLKNHLEPKAYMDSPLVFHRMIEMQSILPLISEFLEWEDKSFEQLSDLVNKSSSRASTIRNLLIWIEAIRRGKMYDRATTWIDKVIQIVKLWDETRLVADSLHIAGEIYADVGDVKFALAYYEEAFDICVRHYEQAHHSPNESQIKHRLMQCANSAGLCCMAIGDLGPAKRWYTEALSAAQSLDDSYSMASIWSNLAEIHIAQGEWQEALDTVNRSLTIHRKLPEGIRAVALDLMTLSKIHRRLSDFAAAEEVVEEAKQIFEAFEAYPQLASALLTLGIIKQQTGNLKQAEDYYQQALSLSRDGENWDTLLSILSTYAGLLFTRGQIEQAKDYNHKVLSRVKHVR